MADVNLLFKVVEKRLKAKMVTVRATVELTCFSKHGINGIKKALKVGLGLNNKQVNNQQEVNNKNDVNEDEQCVIKLIAPPDYNITIDTFDSEEAINRLKKIIGTVKNEIEKCHGSLKIKEEPHVINDVSEVETEEEKEN